MASIVLDNALNLLYRANPAGSPRHSSVKGP
jgi:hypothetical protein